MNTTKRFLAVVLSLAMVISCMAMTVVSADGVAKKLSDVNDSEVYYDAVNTLSVMGIINGYEDGTFKPNQNVTRAEFTAMLMRSLKLGDTGSKSAAGLPFSDIDDNNSDINWAIPNINTAYGKGIINGYEDGTFRPSDNVAYEEAVKMIVCTLGYGSNIDVSVTPWYANYISVASQIGITKTASKIGQAETPASRACIAQLIYDSFDVKLVENDKKTDDTILSSYLGYIKGTGVVYSNDVTSLAGADSNLRDDEVQINGRDDDETAYSVVTYKTTDSNLKNYIGYEVEYYYANDNSSTRNLMFYTLKGNEPIVVNAKDIETSKSSNSQIKYYDSSNSDREKTLTLADGCKVIYNGKYYGAFDTSLVPKVGQIKLIDSNNDSAYDVLDITAYEIYYVSTKDSTNYQIIDNYVQPADNKVLVLDTNKDDNLSIVNKDGKEISFSSISTGNIICVLKSKSGTVTTKAIVLTDKVTGTVSATSGGDKVTIGGKEYEYSEAAQWVSGAAATTTLSAPQMSDSGTFYFDINGDIVAYSKNATTDNTKYGYIEGYSFPSKGFDSDAKLKIINSSGTTEEVSIYKSTTINGQTFGTGEEAVAELKRTAKNQNTGTDADKTDVQQLVKYSTKTADGKKVVDKIITADTKSKGTEVLADKLSVFGTNSASGNAVEMTYNSSSKYLESSDGTKINVSNATVISVPQIRSDYDSFRKTSISTSFKDKQKYTVEFYDVSATNAARVVVYYTTTEGSAEKLDSASPVYVVNEVSEGTNNGDNMQKITGVAAFPDKSTAEVNDEWISTESTSSIKKGNVYRIIHDKDGYTIIDSKNLLYSVDNEKFGLTQDEDEAKTETDIEKAEFVTIAGSVVSKDDDTSTIMIAPQKLTTADKDTYDKSKAYSFTYSKFSGAKVVTYDNTGKSLELKIGDDTSAAIAGLMTLDDGVEPSNVLIYMSEGKIKLLCVLPR